MQDGIVSNIGTTRTAAGAMTLELQLVDNPSSLNLYITKLTEKLPNQR